MAKGVYKIKNVVTGECYVGSSKNLNSRLTGHKCLLKKGQHENPEIQKSFNRYGSNAFVFYILKEVPLETSRDDLLLLEQWYIDLENSEKLFNRTYTDGSKLKKVKNPCYILDLKGSIVKKFSSLTEGLRWLKLPIVEDNVNTDNIYKNKYRIVTECFFKNNFNIIKNWDFVNYYENPCLKTCKLYCDFNNETLEFDDYIHLSKTLNITQSGVIRILKGGHQKNPNNIRLIK